MDDKALEKKFTNKKFLRSNDLAAAAGQAIKLVQENKNLVMGLVVVLIVLGLSIPGLRLYKNHQVQEFNAKMFAANQGLKKSAKFEELIKSYSSLPASQFVRIKLIDDLLDHEELDAAQKEIREGLGSNGADIFKTILVLKQVQMHKNKKEYQKASQFIVEFQNKVILPYMGRLKMLRASLLLQAGKKEEARAVYQQLGNFEGAGAEGAGTLGAFDPVLANQAKDQLLLIDLGLI